LKTLPWKRLARFLSKVAIAGCALSLVLHAYALLGFYSASTMKLVLYLFIGTFSVLIPALSWQHLLLSEFSAFRDVVFGMVLPKFPSHVLSKCVLAKAPRWLRGSSTLLMVYAMGLFVFYLYKPSRTVHRRNQKYFDC